MALERLSEALPSTEIRFLTQYINKDDKYDVKVCLYYAQLNSEEVKKYQERVILYPSEIGTDDLIENDILFGEIDFLKTNVIPLYVYSLISLPVPKSIRRYIWRESADIISPSVSYANFTANDVFPEAVTPIMVMGFVIMVLILTIMNI